MTEQLLLGIDIGTSACKVAVFDTDGNVVAQSNKPYLVYYPQQGYAEQDPEEWWGAIVAAIREILDLKTFDPKKIAGIGVDGQSWSAIPIDRKQNVLYRTPIWMDTRARNICDRAKRLAQDEEIFSIAGNDFLPSYATPKMIWFKENMPEVFGKTNLFLQSNSFIVMKLTGEVSQDLSQGYGIHFFDMKKKEYNAELAEKLGLSVSLVPSLYRCDEIVGVVTKEASELTGLPEGIPVVAGGLDAACGTLGAGVYDVGQTQEQGGQAGGMSICTDSALSHKKLILSTHVVPDRWLLQGGTVGGGGTLKWFKQEFGKDLSFDELTKEAEKVSPGSDGVVFLPYMAGERSPIWDPDAKGVFYGLSFDKTRGHMIRAVLEGVALSLQHNMLTAAETGITVDSLNAMGGSANSLLWTQIKADVTGKRVQVPASDTATTLGAALLAGKGCSIYKDYKEAVEKTIKITRVHEPNAENHEIYKHSMELYLRLYEDLKDTFKEYKDI
ncbi:xylulokinase [Butyrivibrio sp. XB500-5]|uniref:xylulokinase n=1 Tax=Butyrivibrio sp. XB500-5 TaxID=2364880 RepID=UPI000EA90118|nr:xylulokinase [Butyrivibrio sp. XB500-5]RKM56709.1 xylulokinase [Butyrivibrio sp. XB500-5]